MISIGFIERPRVRDSDIPDHRYDESGRVFAYNTVWAPAADLDAEDSEAQLITRQVQAFLIRMAEWEAEHLYGGEVGPRWANAEADHVRYEPAPQTGGRQGFRLALAHPRDVTRPGPSGPCDVSWVYYRLWWLAEEDPSTPPVEIWRVNIGDGALMLARYTRRDRNTSRETPMILLDSWTEPQSATIRSGLNLFHIPLRGGVPVPRGRSDAEDGETIVHELVIHHYRNQRALGTPMPPLDFIYGSSGADAPTGGHLSYPYHALQPFAQHTDLCQEEGITSCGSDAHTLPDIEADLLILYLRNRGMHLLHPDSGPENQTTHDELVRDLREALEAQTHGHDRPEGSQLSPAEYRNLRMYTPSPSGTAIRLPGPQGVQQ